jgi:hypothetical protein
MAVKGFRGFAVPSALLLLAACGGGGGSTTQPSGVQVVLQTSAPFAYQADFDARLQNTISVAMDYWGGAADELNGRSITFVDDPYVACNGTQALGCYDGNIRLTTRDPAIGTFTCVEATVLVHEIGHVVLGDPDHTDPRWMEMDQVAAELSGRSGYTDSGDAPCTTYVSVWRHPLNSP